VLRANRHVFGEGLLTSEGEFWLRSGGWRSRRFTAAHCLLCGDDGGVHRTDAERLAGEEERDAHQE